MKQFLKYGFVVLAVAVVFFARGAWQSNAAHSGDKIPGQYIVVLKDNVPSADDAENGVILKYHAGRFASFRHALKGFAATVSADQVDALRNDPRVAYVAEDRIVSIADAEDRNGGADVEGVHSAARSSYTRTLSQVIPTGISRINAAHKSNKGAGVGVAIIDTGIQLNHPDLQANIVANTTCVSGTTSGNDDNGHGTHVAGIVAALDNTIGVVGVAPQAKLAAVKVLNKNGSGTWSSVICGIDWVTAHAAQYNIKVANMSLGGTGTSDTNCGATNNDPLHAAICRSVTAGVTYAVAAGNSAANVNSFVPAAYPEVIAVSALADSNGKACGMGSATPYGADDTLATFSNFATASGDLARLIAAPGVNIYSTYRGSTYATLSGTSMASPHVTGAATLYVAAHPGATPAQVLTGLRSVAEPVNVNMNGECAVGGSSHTDPSGLHPELELRADTL